MNLWSKTSNEVYEVMYHRSIANSACSKPKMMMQASTPSLAFATHFSLPSIVQTSDNSRLLVSTETRCPELNRSRWVCSTSTSAASQLVKEIARIAGPARGIFGQEAEEREQLESLIRATEAENPTHKPTENNAMAANGKWRLLYTTLEILGRRRVRLALATPRKPGLVNLGDLWQIVDAKAQETQNIVEFSVLGTSGTFTLFAAYTPVSNNRVEVSLNNTALKPTALQELLGENESLLTQIFDPEGFLDITYVDESLRIGRDDKEQVFVLEKVPETPENA